MKTNILVFLAGAAVGAALLKVTDGFISSRKSHEGLVSETRHPGNRNFQDAQGPGLSKRTQRTQKNRQPLAPATSPNSVNGLLDRIAVIRSSEDLDLSALEFGRIVADIGSLSSEKTHDFLMALEKLEETEQWFDPIDEISTTAALRLIELNGLAAVQAFEDNLYPNFSERFGEDFGTGMVTFWTNNDPDAARDWILANVEKDPETRGSMTKHLEDPDVLEAFFLSYENHRRGGSEALVSAISSEDLRNEFMAHSLNARIKLSDDPSELTDALNQSLSLPGPTAQYNLLESAISKDLDSCMNWAEGLAASPQRDNSILTIGRSLMDNDEVNQETGIDWLLAQEIDDPDIRKQRLAILRQNLSGGRTNADFINPVNLITIPEIPNSISGSEITGIVTPELSSRSGSAMVSRNSIDAILNNPLRTSSIHSDPKKFVESLRTAASENHNGRYSRLIEAEILALGLEN